MSTVNRYWVSFAKGKFLGVVLTEAANPSHAIQKINDLGINPGGQAMVCLLGHGRNCDWDRYPKDTLISEDELLAAGYAKLGELDNGVERATADSRIEFVCEVCNETDCRCN